MTTRWGPGELLGLAREVAAQAAVFIAASRPAGRVAVTATKSSATDPVTEIDTATEQLIRARILAVRPDDGFIGEEGGAQHGASAVTWVIDPIDGTVNFVYGIPAYAVSIGVQVDDEVVAGVVLNVATGEEFGAELGRGSWMRNRPGADPVALRVVDGVALGHALVGTGFGYQVQRREAQARAVTALLPQVRDIRRVGSAALDLCSVAAGRLDCYVEQGLHAWDRAAGVLVVREAGGVVTGLAADTPDERLVVAAGPTLHPVFRAAVTAAGF
ncbi:MAG: inositol monophosphatase [Actinomycetota bacterium]|nr:inositol monophosphatase [Actinomycetota bacterium]